MTRSVRIGALEVPVLDALLAGGIAAETSIECWLHPHLALASRVIATVAAILLAVSVAVRRRWPAGALVGGAAIPSLQALAGGSLAAGSGLGMIVALMLLTFAAGSRLGLAPAGWALGGGAVAFTGFVIDSSSTVSAGLGAEAFILTLAFVPPWSAGRVIRRRRLRTTAFETLATQTASQREHREQLAVAAERLRISGELQDIIAHSVSAMVIHAAGARGLLSTDPARARASIAAVEHTGRETLADLRRLLGMLRRDDDHGSLAPPPGLGQVEMLVRAHREGGMTCQLEVVGAPVDLTPGIDLVAYRVIESALRCATARRSDHAAVTVRYTAQALQLRVRSDGAPPDVDHELDGLAQRVALYEGSVQARPTHEGFELTGRLPLGSAVRA